MTTRGQRMKAYLATKTGDRQGWQTDLVRRSGIRRQTITKWTHPDYDGYPDLDKLAAMAEALEVRPYELVAAIDGDHVELPVGLLTSPAFRAAIRASVEEALDARPELRRRHP